MPTVDTAASPMAQQQGNFFELFPPASLEPAVATSAAPAAPARLESRSAPFNADLESDGDADETFTTLRPLDFAFDPTVAAAAAAATLVPTSHDDTRFGATQNLASTSFDWGFQHNHHDLHHHHSQPAANPQGNNSASTQHIDVGNNNGASTSAVHASSNASSGGVCDLDAETNPLGERNAAAVATSAPAAAAAAPVVAKPNGRNSASRLELSTDANNTSGTGGVRKSPNAPIRSRNVYVAALPINFTEADLTALLSEFGKVKSCRMFNGGSRVNEIGRSYGFALYEEPASAERAVAELDGKPLGNARIQCQLSRNGVVKKPKDVRERVRINAANSEATTAVAAASSNPSAAAARGGAPPLLPAPTAQQPTTTMQQPASLPHVGGMQYAPSGAPTMGIWAPPPPHQGQQQQPSSQHQHQHHSAAPMVMISHQSYHPPQPHAGVMMPGFAPGGFVQFPGGNMMMPPSFLGGHPQMHQMCPPPQQGNNAAAPGQQQQQHHQMANFVAAPPHGGGSDGAPIPVMTPQGVVWMCAA